MDPSDIGKAYDQITHLWQRPGFDRSNGIAQHQRALAFASKAGFALDIGCGCTGRFISLLGQHGFSAEGLDVSSQMLRLAKARHPEVPFYHADICTFAFEKRYVFISAWDSIWHLPLASQEPVLRKIVAGLEKGGVFIFSFGGTDAPGEMQNRHMGPEVYYSTLGTNGFVSLMLALGCQIKHLEFDQYPEPHAYLVVQKESD
ncbi:MAG: class I SAM-dependent methyltransferase [Pseudomonadota bacterium]|uniref:class I SAM-dependent DNA methyltransferase n=1 Tax=Gallaecimonas pentaromativorans TaxID=584787 RepID=UPI00067E7BC6|nr:class I SAM-dependent methyltransferase [Gallaecimonas pentaromativorans]MED5523684.1 class I SAM-dependent methyltransferase [Pseudomonadota bacterium]